MPAPVIPICTPTSFLWKDYSRQVPEVAAVQGNLQVFRVVGALETQGEIGVAVSVIVVEPEDRVTALPTDRCLAISIEWCRPGNASDKIPQLLACNARVRVPEIIIKAAIDGIHTRLIIGDDVTGAAAL